MGQPKIFTLRKRIYLLYNTQARQRSKQTTKTRRTSLNRTITKPFRDESMARAPCTFVTYIVDSILPFLYHCYCCPQRSKNAEIYILCRYRTKISHDILCMYIAIPIPITYRKIPRYQIFSDLYRISHQTVYGNDFHHCLQSTVQRTRTKREASLLVSYMQPHHFTDGRIIRNISKLVTYDLSSYPGEVISPFFCLHIVVILVLATVQYCAVVLLSVSVLHRPLYMPVPIPEIFLLLFFRNVFATLYYYYCCSPSLSQDESNRGEVISYFANVSVPLLSSSYYCFYCCSP